VDELHRLLSFLDQDGVTEVVLGSNQPVTVRKGGQYLAVTPEAISQGQLARMILGTGFEAAVPDGEGIGEMTEVDTGQRVVKAQIARRGGDLLIRVEPMRRRGSTRKPGGSTSAPAPAPAPLPIVEERRREKRASQAPVPAPGAAAGVAASAAAGMPPAMPRTATVERTRVSIADDPRNADAPLSARQQANAAHLAVPKPSSSPGPLTAPSRPTPAVGSPVGGGGYGAGAYSAGSARPGTQPDGGARTQIGPAPRPDVPASAPPTRAATPAAGTPVGPPTAPSRPTPTPAASASTPLWPGHAVGGPTQPRPGSANDAAAAAPPPRPTPSKPNKPPLTPSVDLAPPHPYHLDAPSVLELSPPTQQPRAATTPGAAGPPGVPATVGPSPSGTFEAVEDDFELPPPVRVPDLVDAAGISVDTNTLPDLIVEAGPRMADRVRPATSPGIAIESAGHPAPRPTPMPGPAPSFAPPVAGAAAAPAVAPLHAPPVAASDAPTMSLVDERSNVEPMAAIVRGCRERAVTDLHIASGRPVMVRAIGELVPLDPTVVSPQMAEALLLPLLGAQARATLQQRGYVDLAVDVPAAGRLRGNVSRTKDGLKGSFRLARITPPTLDELGLPRELAKVVSHHQGLVVISGPSGHGKTTTLNALVDLVNSSRAHHILMIEDPVEIEHPRKRAVVSQREVGRHTTSFSAALKASLREDPDVIVIGELRDRETVEIALTAAETGHLVITTMSTPSAAKTIDRLIDMFPSEDQPQVRASLGGALRAIIAQRLLPRADRRGVVAAVELLTGVLPLIALIRDNKLFQLPSLMQRGRAFGMLRLDDSLADLVRTGVVAEDMALRASDNKRDLAAMLRPPERPTPPPGAKAVKK
jgi:twitching motility protein PilT